MTGGDHLQVVTNILTQLDNDTASGEDGDGEHQLVVDVHQGGGLEEGRGGSERVTRCYSETDKLRVERTIQLHNCDRQDTLGWL